jgi:hypothetical protein
VAKPATVAEFVMKAEFATIAKFATTTKFVTIAEFATMAKLRDVYMNDVSWHNLSGGAK